MILDLLKHHLQTTGNAAEFVSQFQGLDPFSFCIEVAYIFILLCGYDPSYLFFFFNLLLQSSRWISNWSQECEIKVHQREVSLWWTSTSHWNRKRDSFLAVFIYVRKGMLEATTHCCVYKLILKHLTHKLTSKTPPEYELGFMCSWHAQNGTDASSTRQDMLCGNLDALSWSNKLGIYLQPR